MLLILIINLLTIDACSPAKKVECFAASGTCGALCACDLPVCECCLMCLMCVTGTVADCCECLFPQWDKCNDQTKDHCVVAYTKGTDPRGWSHCSTLDFIKVDYEQSIKYTITEITGSSDISCNMYGRSTMSDCNCNMGYDELYLFPMKSVPSSIELMTNTECSSQGGLPFNPRIVCKSNIDVPTVIKWTWTVQPAPRCCGHSGLKYNSKTQSCCCDRTWNCAVCPIDYCCNDLCCGYPDKCIGGNNCGHPGLI